jgi:hypothetical protein
MSEQRIRAGLAKLDTLTKTAKGAVERDFYKGLSPASNEFFELVPVDVNGQEVKVFRGFLVAGLRAFKRNEKRLIQSTKAGVEFARGIQGQVREGAAANSPAAE